MVFLKNLISDWDLSCILLQYGKDKYPEMIPKYDGKNFIVYGRQVIDTINKLFPLYLKDHGYTVVLK